MVAATRSTMGAAGESSTAVGPTAATAAMSATTVLGEGYAGGADHNQKS